SGEKGRANEPVSNSAHDPPSLARALPVQDRHSSWQTLTDMRVPRALRGSLRSVERGIANCFHRPNSSEDQVVLLRLPNWQGDRQDRQLFPDGGGDFWEIAHC